MSSQVSWDELGRENLTVNAHDTIRLVNPRRFPEIDESRLQLSRRLDVYASDGGPGEQADAAARLIDSLDSRTLQGQPLRPRVESASGTGSRQSTNQEPGQLEGDSAQRPNASAVEAIAEPAPTNVLPLPPLKTVPPAQPSSATPTPATTPSPAATRSAFTHSAPLLALLLLVIALCVLGFALWSKFLT